MAYNVDFYYPWSCSYHLRFYSTGFILLIYVLIKNDKSIFFPVIKAACHIKLMVPFIFIVIMAITFVWACTFLPFRNWIYVKDITFWLLFVGIPTCFHSVGDKLETHYFRNILIDNFKFTALVEFITVTFTFPFAVELMFADRHAA